MSTTKTINSPDAWTEAGRITVVMQNTGCSADDAREYLTAEEGDQEGAILSYQADRMNYGAMR